MKEKKSETKKMEEKNKDTVKCNDERCPVHGTIAVRGRKFKGYVTRAGNKKATIEFERVIYIQKYERYAKKKTRIHAHLPDCMTQEVKIGDYIEVGECRPLSKTIHHVVTNAAKSEAIIKK